MRESNWPPRGLGRKLATSLELDRATISRDIHYLIEWWDDMATRIGYENADQVIRALAAGNVHPRDGYGFKVTHHRVERVDTW
jgi:hypothetical protein